MLVFETVAAASGESGVTGKRQPDCGSVPLRPPVGSDRVARGRMFNEGPEAGG